MPRANLGTLALCSLAINQGIFHFQRNQPKDDYNVNSMNVCLAAVNDVCKFRTFFFGKTKVSLKETPFLFRSVFSARNIISYCITKFFIVTGFRLLATIG
jgi:hypothetical protein